jgi:hypothetical protein
MSNYYLQLQITPTKETEIALVPIEQSTKSVNAPDIATSTNTPHKNDDTIFVKVNYNRLISFLLSTYHTPKSIDLMKLTFFQLRNLTLSNYNPSM